MVVRIGIVGFGKMGILHAGIINSLSNSRVIAICEKEGLLAKAAKKILPQIPFYENVSEMLRAESIDGVFVTTPIHTHSSIVETILQDRPGTAIFTEKPLASNSKEALEIVKTVSSRKIANMVGFQKRFSPIFRHAKKLLDGGAMGSLQFFRSHSYVSDIFHQGEGWRFMKGSGGALLDLGPHLVDLLSWYLGELTPISAVKKSLYSSDVEDYVHAVLSTDVGAVGSMEVSWSVRNYRLPEVMIDIHGTNGSLTVTDDYVRVQVDESVPGVASAGGRILQRPEFETGVEFLLADPEFSTEDQYFLQAIQNGSIAEPTFQAGAKVNQVIDMIHQEAD